MLRAFRLFTLSGLSFSLSYGYILPSSLTRVFPRTLEFSSCLPVSVCGTGGSSLTRSFSWQSSPSPFVSVSRNSPSHLGFQNDGFACHSTYLLGHALPTACAPSFLRHSLAQTRTVSTGISTCCPSPTRLRLGLGPDLPWDDERCPGTLWLSVERILTFLFATHTGILSSCLSTCPSGQASPLQERSPTQLTSVSCQSFGSVL